MPGLVRRTPETAMSRPSADAVSRWDPWNELNQIRSQMDHLFQEAFSPSTGRVGGFTPAVNLYETKDQYTLHVYLPGLSKEDIQLEVAGNAVHIWGEAKPQFPEKDATVHLAQGAYGQFDIRYSLPLELDAERVQGNYRNGVLEVVLPKSEAVKPKTIPVRIES